MSKYKAFTIAIEISANCDAFISIVLLGAENLFDSVLSGRRISLFTDLCIIVIAFFTTFFLLCIVKGHPDFAYGLGVYYKTLCLVVLSWTTSLLLTVKYPERPFCNYKNELGIVLRISFIAILFVTFFAFFLKFSDLSRLFIGLYTLSVGLYMLIFRYIRYLVIKTVWQSRVNQKTCIVIGNSAKALQYVDTYENYKSSGLHFVGYLSDEMSETILSIPVLGTLRDIYKILHQFAIEIAIIALPLADPRTEFVVSALQEYGIGIELLLDGLTTPVSSIQVLNTMGVWHLSITNGNYTKLAMIGKRLTDIILSCLGLIVLSPVFLLIAVLIKWEDGGTVIYAQERVGQHRKRFCMFKFRSMHVDADKRKAEFLHMNEMSGPVFKIRNDPRVTRIGRFLRRTSLDELPQLWNVFIGDMGLVGPRPPLPDEVQQYRHAQNRRLSVKPGITGLWQVSGRNNIDFDQWMELDLSYIDNWSYFLDLKILLKTIPAVLRQHGAS